MKKLFEKLEELKRVILQEQEIPLRRKRPVEDEEEEEVIEDISDLYEKLEIFLEVYDKYLVSEFEKQYRFLKSSWDDIKKAVKKDASSEEIKIVEKYVNAMAEQFRNILRYYDLGSYFSDDLKDLVLLRSDREVIDIFDDNLDFTDYFESGLKIISREVFKFLEPLEKLEDIPEYEDIILVNRNLTDLVEIEGDFYRKVLEAFKPFKTSFDKLYDIVYAKWKEEQESRKKEWEKQERMKKKPRERYGEYYPTYSR